MPQHPPPKLEVGLDERQQFPRLAVIPAPHRGYVVERPVERAVHALHRRHAAPHRLVCYADCQYMSCVHDNDSLLIILTFNLPLRTFCLSQRGKSTFSINILTMTLSQCKMKTKYGYEIIVKPIQKLNSSIVMESVIVV